LADLCKIRHQSCATEQCKLWVSLQWVQWKNNSLKSVKQIMPAFSTLLVRYPQQIIKGF